MRLLLVRSVVAAGLAAGLLLSPNLWQSARAYPTVPVWDALPDIPPAGGRVAFGVLLALLALVVALPRRRWPVLAFVAVAGLWSLWDQTRWQPWFLQYLAFLLAVGAARDGALDACRLVLAATYFWSGLQKVNVSFVTDIYPWMIAPVQRHLPEGVAAWLEGQGYLVAAGESGLGLLLLVPRLRLVAVPMVVVMHLGLLFCLGPTGHNWNTVVWPWNATLAALVVVLFARSPDVAARRILWPASRVGRGLLVLFGVMPAFSFVGWWDAYPAMSLYSGTTPWARITLDETAGETLPAEVRARFVTDGELDLQAWAIDELNVPGYPARRVFRGIARRLGGPNHVRLVTYDRPDWRTGVRPEIEEELERRRTSDE
ncbi:hypothetical protein [Urbifossiella limnaea]|uniref:HTTM domain-containing protein n=1 Tax=Urbifossiella limnaea TaxID=2528023 RepID=A0A517XYA6_9BACT|nr:hypothetical protein [Urbifossiella limnaea]QDU22448.1 hypothetical protein ETAA1_44280 [Urbifossiella limnaea]